MLQPICIKYKIKMRIKCPSQIAFVVMCSLSVLLPWGSFLWKAHSCVNVLIWASNSEPEGCFNMLAMEAQVEEFIVGRHRLPGWLHHLLVALVSTFMETLCFAWINNSVKLHCNVQNRPASLLKKTKKNQNHFYHYQYLKLIKLKKINQSTYSWSILRWGLVHFLIQLDCNGQSLSKQSSIWRTVKYFERDVKAKQPKLVCLCWCSS